MIEEQNIQVTYNRFVKESSARVLFNRSFFSDLRFLKDIVLKRRLPVNSASKPIL